MPFVITSFVASRGARDMRVHIFCMLQHNAYNVHGNAGYTLQHIFGRLPRKQLKTDAQLHCHVIKV
jgi:hypothetical protein